MRIILIFAIAAVSLLTLISCESVEVNKVLTFEIGGPCEECPIERIDSMINYIEGVDISNMEYDTKTGIMKLGIDTNLVKEQTVINALNEAGYNVDLQIAQSYSFWCCDQNSGEVILPDDMLDEDEELMREFEDELNAELDGDKFLDELNLDKELDAALDGNDISMSELDDDLLIDESAFDIQIDDSELDKKRN